jgi:DNA-directed RNA polymerase beta subunit
MNPLLDTTGGPAGTRAFGDVDATRRAIYEQALHEVQNYQPLANTKYVLELADPAYEGPETYTKADEKRALLEGRSLGRRLRGTWRLRTNDDTRRVVDQKRTTLASIPHMTPRGTFIVNGNEYSLSHQMRLRPGIFTRVKESGELESHVNVARGFGHRYFLDPETGIFRIQIGQARMPLMPVLRALGATDSQLRKAWGNELYVANAKRQDPRTLKKLYQKFKRGSSPDNDDEMYQTIRAAFDDMVLDPEVTQRTLGKGFTKVNVDAILTATAKLLRVHKGEEDADDRDSLAFQRTVGPEDLFAERIRKAAGEARRALWKATLPGNLKKLQPGLFEKMVRGAILETQLGAPIEEINPAELYDHRMRITRMGEGGIPSSDAVPDEARMVHPSQLNFVDSVHTPECLPGASEVMTYEGWVRWDEATEDHRFACLINGQLEFHKPIRIIRQHYRGLMYGMRTQTTAYCVTPNHRLWTRPYAAGEPNYRFETAEYSHMRARKHRNGGHGAYVGRDVEVFELPALEKGSNAQKEFVSVPIDLWCAFMGWYLSEGNSTYVTTVISQSSTASPQHCQQIEQLLNLLGWRWSYCGHAFTISGRQLADYCSRFGLCHEKYIPADLFEAPEHARRMLLDTLLAGDGRKGNTQQYCTTSKRLAEDVQRLCFGLGISTQIVFEPDERAQANHGGCWVVHLHKYNERIIRKRMRSAAGGYYTEEYDDMVYCATVPGGLMYVRHEGKGGIWTGNSGKIGIDTRLTIRTLKGKDGRIYSRFYKHNKGAGKPSNIVWRSPQDVEDAVVAFPGELESDKPFVRVRHKSKLKYVPRDAVDYQPVHFSEGFGPLASLVAAKPNAYAQRISMGSRMITQALPMENPEAPLVQSGYPGMPDTSFEDLLGEDMGAVRAPAGGTVLEVTPDYIKLRGRDNEARYVELYNNFPYARKTYVHNTPTVRPGDAVQPGQLLATSNFTDRNGTTALGKNTRVAYLPYKGFNFEDAIVISESFAKRASSAHMYQDSLDLGEGVKPSKNAFTAIFPGTYDRKLLEKYDDDGVIRPGETVDRDDPLILAVKERKTGPKLGRRKASWADASVKWDHHAPGVVTDVHKGPKGISVLVKAVNKTEVGDKFAGRYGDKGVVAAIVPDEDMPHDQEGQPYEMLLNPLGIISRGNPSQIIEAQLGKIAARTGKPYKLADFDNIRDMRAFAEAELRKNGLQDKETVIDPKTGRKIEGIDAGNRFMLKLHHTAEAKLQGRAAGGGYSAEGAPAKGGKSGSKRVGMLELAALLSHGAYHTIRDASVIRGQRNEDYWRMLMSGYAPPAPKVPFVYQKFMAQLKGAGINPVKRGARMQIMPMTGQSASELTGNRELRSAETVDWRVSKLTPVKGGLFDEKLTGGHGGNRWSYMKLPEPLPNPVMEEPIRRILGLTQKQFANIVAGRESLPGRDGLTGPSGLRHALEDINLEKEIARARAEIAGGKKTYRDKAVRRLQFLKGAVASGQHPKDWIMDRVPVLPPIFRPVSLFADSNTPLVDDPNYLYKEVQEATKNYNDLAKVTDDVSDERLAIYNAFKGVTGLGDPITPENKEQGVRGILKHIFGSSPKFGTVQRKLLGSTVDLVGRATITPNPNLDIDHVGLPIDKAWTLYQPFVVRRLVRRGMGKLQAMQAAKDRTPEALRELQAEMDVRPVIINRAPVLHRFGVMAFWPELTSSNTLEIPPFTVGGFGADFDGDAMQFHVPSSDAAVDEAKNQLLPSRNLRTVSDFDIAYGPSMEYVGGLWEATAQRVQGAPRVFRTKKDAIAAYNRGEISAAQAVDIVEH